MALLLSSSRNSLVGAMSSIRDGLFGGRETTERLDQILWDHGTGSRAVKPPKWSHQKKKKVLLAKESLVADGHIFHPLES